MDIINAIFTAFVAAIQGTTTAVVVYALPILGFCAGIWMFYQTAQEVARGGSHLGETLGNLLFRLLTIGFYMWVLTNWLALTTAILETMLFFATAGGANTLARELLTSPGRIWVTGQQTIHALASFDTWQRSIATTFGFFVNPLDLASYLLILAAFLGMTINHGMLLIEFALATFAGAITLPWALLRPVGHLGEFAVGWLTGAAIRVLVSCVILGIAVVLFATLDPPTTTTAPGFVDPMSGVVFSGPAPKYGQTFTLLGGSFVFFVLCLVIPGRAARMAGGASLALTGSDVVSSAMTIARFGMMTAGVIRGTSRLVTGLAH